ncbi:M56 family metallopeptidase [Actinokineospora guangxiensis]|uniref:M56 family metallopeptidase n=1 Tax=Actinokineospora guangxiensis TaxID=1490288 RepID=A0ABW0EZF7_9PSEU
MYNHVEWSVFVVPVVVVALVWLIADRVQPSTGLKVVTWSAVAAAAASTVTLAVFALKALAEVPAVAAVGDWSREVLVANSAHVPWMSELALLWLAVSAVVACRAVVRRRRRLRQVEAEIANLGAVDDVVHVDSPEVIAVAVRRRDGQGRIVLSSAALAQLDERQRRAVIAHERAHLAGGHHRLLWLARLAAIAHPLLWPLAIKAAHLAERAADEEAATAVGDRRVVARAIGRLGLAGASVAARGVPAAVGASAGSVPRRVSALLTGASGRRWPALLPPLIAAGTIVSTGECVYDFVELLVSASH